VLDSPYREPGFNAFSNTGVNITNQVVVSNNIDTTTLGTYRVLYSITDAFGFNQTKQRTVIVRDIQKPVIFTLSGNDTVIHQLGAIFEDVKYVDAKDNYWGISASQIQRTGNINVNQSGIYAVRYNVVDGSGNAANELTVWVWVRDVQPPSIQLIGAAEVTIDVFTVYSERGVTMSDNNSTPTLTISGSVNWNVIGQYTLTYTATDASDNTASVTRTVNVVDRVAPTITLKGTNPYRADYNRDTPSYWATLEPGVIVSDNYDNPSDITLIIDSSEFVRTVPGTYYIYYQAVDKSNNRSPIIFRKVLLQFPVGIHSVWGNEKIQVYPNPSSGKFKIDGLVLTGAKLSVYDMTGKRVFTQTMAATSEYEIDLTAQEQGMYQLVIEHEGKTYHAKLNVIK
jgi:hypothetical protein